MKIGSKLHSVLVSSVEVLTAIGYVIAMTPAVQA